MNKNYNIAIAKALIFLRPNHPTGHTILAKAFAKEKFLDRALECWTEARSRFPKQDKIIRGRIRTLKALNRFDEAIMEAEHLIALKPDDPSGTVGGRFMFSFNLPWATVTMTKSRRPTAI